MGRRWRGEPTELAASLFERGKGLLKGVLKGLLGQFAGVLKEFTGIVYWKCLLGLRRNIELKHTDFDKYKYSI